MTWLLFITLMLTPQKSHKKDAAPHAMKAFPNDGPTIPLPITAASDSGGKPELAKQKPSSSSEKFVIWWKRPEWVIVYITALYTLVSLGTLYVIWKQNRSIQNTDRAVLIPMWENFVHLTPEGQGRKHTFQVNFKNFGKTPAFIRGHQCNITLISDISELPINPKYRSEVVYRGDPLVPDAVTDRAFYSLLDGESDFDDISDEYRKNGRILYAFGFIRYEDIYGGSHTTKYGLRYIAGPTFSRDDGWIIDGPKSYNQYK